MEGICFILTGHKFDKKGKAVKTVKLYIILSTIIALSLIVSSVVVNYSDPTIWVNSKEITAYIIPNRLIDANAGMTIDLQEIGLDNLVIRRKEKGKTNYFNEFVLYVYILGDYNFSKSSLHDSYLAVEKEDALLLFDLGKDIMEDILYLNDVDGDGIDEIIIHQTLGMTGGAGQYSSRILKVVEDEIQEIFSSSPDNVFNTSFTSEFLDDKQLSIRNERTGYSKVIDITKRINGEFFIERGELINRDKILCDSFYSFIPEDTDNDGVFEIIAFQYVSILTHAGYIGYTKCVIKFNLSSQNFEVISSEFFV